MIKEQRIPKKNEQKRNVADENLNASGLDQDKWMKPELMWMNNEFTFTVIVQSYKLKQKNHQKAQILSVY